MRLVVLDPWAHHMETFLQTSEASSFPQAFLNFGRADVLIHLRCKSST